jgi:hypothetical protein
LGTDKSIENLTTGMEDFATGIAEVIKEIGVLSAAISSVPVLGELIGLLFKSSPLGLLIKLGGDTKKANMGKGVAYSGTSQYFTAESAARAKSTSIIKANNAAEQAKLKLAQADLEAKKKASDLDELKKKFDINRINLETALLNSKDEAEKARIRSLLTIMDEDANSAKTRLDELAKANADKLKAEQTAADNLKKLGDAAEKTALKLLTIGNPNGDYPSGTPYDPRSGNTPDAPRYPSGNPPYDPTNGNTPDSPITPDISNGGDMGNPNGIYDYSASSPSFTYSPPITNNFVFNDAVGTSDDFAEAVKRAIQKVNRFGDSTTYAGAL